MTQMQRRHLHLPPTPTQVDFLVVAKEPTLLGGPHDGVLKIGNHPEYTDGVIDVVITDVTQPYLNVEGHAVGYTAEGRGPEPWVITLGQNQKTGQFVVYRYYGAVVHGSIQQWEREVAHKS